MEEGRNDMMHRQQGVQRVQKESRARRSWSSMPLSTFVSSSTLWWPVLSWPAATSANSPLVTYPWSANYSSCTRLSSYSNWKESSVPSRESRSSISSYPRLISVLAWSMTLLLISSCIGLTDAGILNGHPLGKRSFIDIQCKGIYDKSIFARLDRICEDCYNLFREPQLHQLCRKNCFTSDYFKGCLDVLLLQDEVEKIQTWIKQLHGAEPGV